jgi:hypothetical protein
MNALQIIAVIIALMLVFASLTFYLAVWGGLI